MRQKGRKRDECTIFLVVDSCSRQQLMLCLLNASHNSSFIARVPYSRFYFMEAQRQPLKTFFFSLLREFPQDFYVGDASRM